MAAASGAPAPAREPGTHQLGVAGHPIAHRARLGVLAQIGPPDWEQSAQAWLLISVRPTTRGPPRPAPARHTVVLAWLARRHAEASWRAMGSALASARAELADVVEVGVVEAAIGAIEKEQARLVAAGRAITLILESLLGHRHAPRL